ncbi:MAG: purine-nucleoside phosphorylase [Lacrimispora sp.]|uniref:purine-nucleoside phosphorylase n=1 Tax=Lacrimispora sp. TaxID=2719234 RepID=UPI0039E6BCC1
MKSSKELMADKESLVTKINEAVQYIKSKTTRQPQIGIVLGTGLGPLAEQLEEVTSIPYGDIPHFPTPTIAGHSGRLLIGELGGQCIAAMQGRVHYYEGYDTAEITFPVRVLDRLGIKTIILTNACGAVSKHFAPGDLMVIEDHLSFFCPSPLRGGNLDEFGERFVDMSAAYTPELVKLAENTAKELGQKLQKGVYGYWHGPTFETAAEIRGFMALGADVVGMSTVPEAIVARHCGLNTLGISCITNMTCIYGTDGTNHEDVIEVGNQVSEKFIALIKGIVEKI